MKSNKIWSSVFDSLSIVGAGIALTVIIDQLISKINLSDNIIKLVTGLAGGGLGILIMYFIGRVLMRKTLATVFMAHAFSDNEIARKISDYLSNYRIRVIDEKEILSLGKEFTLNLDRSLNESDYVIVIVSNNMKNDQLLNTLIEAMKLKGKKLIPIYVSNVKNPPNTLSEYPSFSVTEKNVKKVSEKVAESVLAES